MKKSIKALFLILSIVISTNSTIAETRGKILQSLQFKSKILGALVNYSIYLPANYDKTEKEYSVLYLLHGFTDDETFWINSGWVDQAADQGIISGEVNEMIIVMPDGGLKWYVNQPSGKFNYEDMFIKELIPFIEKNYRVKSDKKNRSIGGVSMGGYGALGYSMRHPDIFATCISFSAAIRPDDEVLDLPQKSFNRHYAPVYGKNLKGEARLSKHWKENNPLYLAKKISEEKLKSVNWYITCGDDDYLSNGSSTLHQIFRKRGIPNEYRVYNGEHGWNYWRKHIKEGLIFISKFL